MLRYNSCSMHIVWSENQNQDLNENIIQHQKDTQTKCALKLVWENKTCLFTTKEIVCLKGHVWYATLHNILSSELWAYLSVIPHLFIINIWEPYLPAIGTIQLEIATRSPHTWNIIDLPLQDFCCVINKIRQRPPFSHNHEPFLMPRTLPPLPTTDSILTISFPFPKAHKCSHLRFRFKCLRESEHFIKFSLNSQYHEYSHEPWYYFACVSRCAEILL